MRWVMSPSERIAGLVLLVCGVLVSVYAAGTLKLGMVVSPDAGFLPFFLGVALSVLALFWLASGLVRPAGAADAPATVPAERRLRLLVVLAVVLAYAWLLERIGYLPATLAFLASWQFLVERERWLKATLVSALGTLALYALFALLMRVPLPQGRWIG